MRVWWVGFSALNPGLKDPTIQEDILPQKSRNPKQHSLQEELVNFSAQIAHTSADKVRFLLGTGFGETSFVLCCSLWQKWGGSRRIMGFFSSIHPSQSDLQRKVPPVGWEQTSNLKAPKSSTRCNKIKKRHCLVMNEKNLLLGPLLVPGSTGISVQLRAVAALEVKLPHHHPRREEQ